MGLKKKTVILLLACMTLFASAFSGCAFGVRGSSTGVTVDETGWITEEIVENRGAEDYTEEELISFIQDQVDRYNRQKESDAVKLNSCMAQGNSVKISMGYASFQDYAEFNQVVCFNGTLQEAADAGYELDRNWYEPNGTKGDMGIIQERFKEWKVFIISEPIHVKVSDKILYASDNVRVTGRLSAVVKTVMNETQSEDTGAASSSGTQTAKPQVTVHPLATVAERFAYVIYK